MIQILPHPEEIGKRNIITIVYEKKVHSPKMIVLFHKKIPLENLVFSRVLSGDPSEIRTPDTLIKSHPNISNPAKP